MPNERKRCCVNCGNNIRTTYEKPFFNVVCRCQLDGHRIGYIECFEGWCKHWCKDKKGVNNNAK